MTIDKRTVVLLALAAALAGVTWLAGLQVAVTAVVIATVMWSASPFNEPDHRN